MASAAAFWVVPSSHLPITSTISNFFPDLAITSWKPSCRSRSAEFPEGPRISRSLPVSPLIVLSSQRAAMRPSSCWSTSTWMLSGDSIRLSKESSTTPAALALLATGANAAGLSALTMTAS